MESGASAPLWTCRLGGSPFGRRRVETRRQERRRAAALHLRLASTAGAVARPRRIRAVHGVRSLGSALDEPPRRLALRAAASRDSPSKAASCRRTPHAG